jgi:hypothetical protein
MGEFWAFPAKGVVDLKMLIDGGHPFLFPVSNASDKPDRWVTKTFLTDRGKREEKKKTDLASQDVGDAHQVIVDNASEMVRREAVWFEEDDVVYRWRRVDFGPSIDKVGEGNWRRIALRNGVVWPGG